VRTDTEVRIRGLRALIEALGTVEAERYITLILREPFDYRAGRDISGPIRVLTK
jgi:hypothetical protein